MKTLYSNCVQITGGIYRNRRIKLVDQKRIRPTSSKVREAIFSMIGQNLAELSFLDAFGGSGIMGMEAYSRGARPVCIIERSRSTVKQIHNQVQQLDAVIQIRHLDAKIGLRENWDIVFLDPPYSMSILPFLKLALQEANHIVIAETPSGEALDTSDLDDVIRLRGWTLWKHKLYGATTIRIWHRPISDVDQESLRSSEN